MSARADAAITMIKMSISVPKITETPRLSFLRDTFAMILSFDPDIYLVLPIILYNNPNLYRKILVAALFI